MVEQLAIQLEDGGSKPTSPLHYRIDPMPHNEAMAFVEKWHYSHRMPTGKNVCFGVWNHGSVYAAIVYGIGVNPYQAKFLGVNAVVEIKRMCRREPKESFELSRFIRLTTRMARKVMPFDAVVAFADPEQGHEGTVYKAAGFTHEGMSNAEWHLIGEDGEKRHRRFAFRMARRNGITVAEAREALGMRRVETAPKHRWVLRLCTANGAIDQQAQRSVGSADTSQAQSGQIAGCPSADRQRFDEVNRADARHVRMTGIKVI